jgi:hypothetical protein
MDTLIARQCYVHKRYKVTNIRRWGGNLLSGMIQEVASSLKQGTIASRGGMPYTVHRMTEVHRSSL